MLEVARSLVGVADSAINCIDSLDPRFWLEPSHQHRIYGDDAGIWWGDVDEEDYEYLIQWRWCIKMCRRNKPYLRRAVNRYENSVRVGADSIYMHVAIMERTGIKRPSKRHKLVDHMDGNSLNCRRENLRWATHTMNNRNVHGSFVRQGVLV